MNILSAYIGGKKIIGGYIGNKKIIGGEEPSYIEGEGNFSLILNHDDNSHTTLHFVYSNSNNNITIKNNEYAIKSVSSHKGSNNKIKFKDYEKVISSNSVLKNSNDSLKIDADIEKLASRPISRNTNNNIKIMNEEEIYKTNNPNFNIFNESIIINDNKEGFKNESLLGKGESTNLKLKNSSYTGVYNGGIIPKGDYTITNNYNINWGNLVIPNIHYSLIKEDTTLTDTGFTIFYGQILPDSISLKNGDGSELILAQYEWGTITARNFTPITKIITILEDCEVSINQYNAFFKLFTKPTKIVKQGYYELNLNASAVPITDTGELIDIPINFTDSSDDTIHTAYTIEIGVDYENPDEQFIDAYGVRLANYDGNQWSIANLKNGIINVLYDTNVPNIEIFNFIFNEYEEE